MGSFPAFVAWILGIAGGIAALVAAIDGIPKLWRLSRKLIETVDVIAALPATLDHMDQRLAEHVREGETRTRRLDARIDELVSLTHDVRHEVRTNSGSSMNDSVRRTERSVGRLEAALTDQPTPTPVPVVSVKPARARKPRTPKPPMEAPA